jgi:nucleotide-binding universal stress UspA family protein
MLDVDCLLVATDFSRSAERARRQAEHLAALHDAALHVVHVTDDPELAELFEGLPPERATPRRTQVYLAEWLGRPIAPPRGARATAPPRAVPPAETWTVRYDPAPADGILESAEDVGADVLLVGAGTRGGLFGGVADRVLRGASVPVIAVPAGPDDARKGPRIPDIPPREALDRILVPVEFSPLTGPLVEHARVLAEGSRATIDLVHVQSDAPSVWGDWRPNGRRGSKSGWVHRRLKAVADRESPPDRPVRSRVLHGDAPAPVLVRYAEENDTDLILMGTHARTGLRRMVQGNVAERVIREAPCPVGVLKGETRLLESRDDGGATAEADRPAAWTPVLV